MAAVYSRRWNIYDDFLSVCKHCHFASYSVTTRHCPYCGKPGENQKTKIMPIPVSIVHTQIKKPDYELGGASFLSAISDPTDGGILDFDSSALVAPDSLIGSSSEELLADPSFGCSFQHGDDKGAGIDHNSTEEPGTASGLRGDDASPGAIDLPIPNNQ